METTTKMQSDQQKARMSNERRKMPFSFWDLINSEITDDGHLLYFETISEYLLTNMVHNLLTSLFY